MSFAPDFTSRLLRRERLIILVGVVLLAVLSWWFVAAGGGMPDGMGAPAAPFGALVLMWWLMMMAMMLPSAVPAILLYARVRQAWNNGPAIAQSWIFLFGYVAVWLLFSIGAALAQRLSMGGLMMLDNRYAKAAILIAAGGYQLSPLKTACVSVCRSPAQFISRHWRPGWDGAIRLGLMHGIYCVGCCWLLMALLFVVGVMNLLWVVALTVVVTIEKLVPKGALLGRSAGVGLLAWGALKLAGH